MVPSPPNCNPRLPVGKPCFRIGTGYSVTFAVLGSSRPMFCSLKLEYHAIPCESTMTSCGSIIARGRSYSVMMTSVSFPLGREDVLRGYVHVEPELKLIVLRNRASRC